MIATKPQSPPFFCGAKKMGAATSLRQFFSSAYVSPKNRQGSRPKGNTFETSCLLCSGGFYPPSRVLAAGEQAVTQVFPSSSASTWSAAHYNVKEVKLINQPPQY